MPLEALLIVTVCEFKLLLEKEYHLTVARPKNDPKISD